MAEESRFFAGPNYTAQDHIDVWRRLMNYSGVVSSRENGMLLVSADGSGMDVDIATGEAFVDGYWYRNTVSLNKSITAADGTNDRIDRVVLRLTKASVEVVTTIIDGTPAAIPVLPAMTRTTSVYDIEIGYVLVNSGVSSIAAGKVTDRRFIDASSGVIANDMTVSSDTPDTGKPGQMWMDVNTSPGVLKVEDDDNTFIRVSGVRAIKYPASVFVLDTSGSPERILVSGTNLPHYELRYDDSTDESAWTPAIQMPSDYSSGTVTVRIKWKGAATTNDVIWNVDYLAVGDDDIWDAAFTTGGTVTDTAKGTAEDVNEASMTFTLTATASDEIIFKVTRDADNGSDTFSGDARLLSVEIELP